MGGRGRAWRESAGRPLRSVCDELTRSSALPANPAARADPSPDCRGPNAPGGRGFLAVPGRNTPQIAVVPARVHPGNREPDESNHSKNGAAIPAAELPPAAETGKVHGR